MIVENLFEEMIFPGLKNYVESNSNALVSKKKVDSYPLVVAKLLWVKNQYNSLDYKEKTYIFKICIEMYSNTEDIGSITELVMNYLENNFRVSLRLEFNVSEEMFQNNIIVTGQMISNIVYPFEDNQE